MIIVKRNYTSSYRHYAWQAQYGNLVVFGRDADTALQRAWSVWGGNVAALVHAC